MPIDADAYMAGAIPTLSRGGSWVPYDTSGGGGGTMSQPTSPSGLHMPVAQPSIYTGMPQQVLGGFFQNPLMLGRMAAFGSSGMEQPSQGGRPGVVRQKSYESSVPLSPHHQRQSSSSMSHTGGQSRGSVAGGSPLRYGGWTSQGSQESTAQRRVRKSPGEQSGVSPSLLSTGHRKSHSWESGSWERGSGAPKFLPAEADYGRITSARPTAPKSLPLSEVERQEDKRRYRSQPRSRRPDRLLEVSGEMSQDGSPTSLRYGKPSPLSGFSPVIQEETSQRSSRVSDTVKTARFARPGISRRHTSQDTVPPPEPRRTRVNSTPHPPSVLDMRSMRDALPPVSAKPQSHLSHEDDEYDRYVAHPAVHSPTTVDRFSSQQEVSLQPIVVTKKVQYTPLGYAAPTKELEWNRDGPAMKTYGVAWKREADVLPAGPEGPRWVQARPPRAAEVRGGGWWESGGQGIDA